MRIRIECFTVVLLLLVPLTAAAQVENRFGPNGSPGQNAPTVLGVTGGTGGAGQSGSSTGAGGGVRLTGGTGGSGSLGSDGGAGGGIQITSGPGGFPFGAGGVLQLKTGAGAAAAGGCPIPPGPPCSNFGGSGGSVRILAGSGGSGVAQTDAFSSGGAGGSITLQPGHGGAAGHDGHPGPSGNVLLAPSFGKVGVGFSSPTVTLEVAPGGGTLADAWNVRSSRAFKTKIQPLTSALEKIQSLQGVSYETKANGKQEIGLIAEDVDRVVPEVILRDPLTKEVEGLDYSRLSALLIEAVKSQQAELQSQKAEIERLKGQIERLAALAAMR